MRIVHLLNHSRKANGHVEVAVDLACEQARQGHDVTFAAGAGDFDDCLAASGVARLHIADKRSLGAVAMTVCKLAARFRRSEPDVVHAHMVASALIARVAQSVSSYSLITTVHNSFDRQSRLMGAGNLVIAVSEAVKREMEGVGIPPAKLRVVRNGTVNGARRPLMPTETIALSRPAIATVAGLHARKGIDTLIKAFAEMRASGKPGHLYIAGHGPDRAKLEEQAEASGFGHDIHFMGYMSDPRSVLAGADIFVLASLAEPCGLALIEARQMGCACVATNVGGNPEILDFGKSGRLFVPGDHKELAGVLTALVSDAALLGAMRQSARSGLHYWTVERMARETVHIYEEATDRHRQRVATRLIGRA